MYLLFSKQTLALIFKDYFQHKYSVVDDDLSWRKIIMFCDGSNSYFLVYHHLNQGVIVKDLLKRRRDDNVYYPYTYSYSCYLLNFDKSYITSHFCNMSLYCWGSILVTKYKEINDTKKSFAIKDCTICSLLFE